MTYNGSVMQCGFGDVESVLMFLDADYNLYSATLKDMPKYSYTFILLSTPATSFVDSEEVSVYEPSFNEPLHMDLKRNIYIRDDNNSNKTVDMRPLFEKYQFFTPGKFHAHISLFF